MRKLLFSSAIAVCACQLGGNVIGTEKATLATITVAAGADVKVADIALEILDVREDDGQHTHKSHSLRYAVEGATLTEFSPGFKYACAIAGGVLVDHTFLGNDPRDGKLEPDLPLRQLDDYLRMTRSEPTVACEFELMLEQRSQIQPMPDKRERRPIGKVCYRRDGALTEGACPEGTLTRASGGAGAVGVAVVGAREVTSQPGAKRDVVIGSVLTLNRPIPSEGLSVSFKADCDGKSGSTTLGSNHFAAAAPGESIWWSGSLLGPEALTGEVKQCEFTVFVKAGETDTEAARHCYTGGVLKGGGCG